MLDVGQLSRSFFNNMRLQTLHICNSPVLLEDDEKQTVNVGETELAFIFALLHAHFNVAHGVFIAGVFWEPGVQAWWFEALPDAGDSRHGSVWAVEDGTLQKLHAERSGGPSGPDSGSGSTLDTSVPGSKVHLLAS